ncbi:MAG: ParB/RepB/Spo0J family partition protein [Pseudomonadota bacterium]
MSEENSRKRLGRGLAALMGDLDQPISKETNPSVETKEETRGERDVPIEQIRANPNNPRKHFSDSELEDLTSSIKEHGIVQPILVRPIRGEDLGGAQFEIIAGERRWRAAQRARLHDVPIIVRDVEDKQALELAIIENVQRADLDAVEEALGYQQLIDGYDYSQNDLARVIGKSRSHVANTLRLLKLPDTVRQLITQGDLSAGHARTLITVDDPDTLAKKIVLEGLSVRQAEMLAQGKPDVSGSGGKKASKEKSADIRALEQRLEDKLGLKIDLRHGDKEKGELRIKYRSLDQLDEVCRRLESGF